MSDDSPKLGPKRQPPLKGTAPSSHKVMPGAMPDDLVATARLNELVQLDAEAKRNPGEAVNKEPSENPARIEHSLLSRLNEQRSVRLPNTNFWSASPTLSRQRADLGVIPEELDYNKW